jgi:hypothetical protein
MKKGFIIIAVVLLITLYIMNKVNTARQLEFSIDLPKNIRVQGASVLFDLPLNCLNVSGGTINVKGADITVYSGGKELGKALITNPITIAPKSTTTLMTKVTISFFDVLTASGSIVNLFKQGKANLSLDGVIYAEGFQFPISQTFDFDTKQIA